VGKSIYIVNPAADMPSYFSAEVLAARGLAPGVSTADVSIALVAALVPAGFDIALCDENITRVNFDHSADYVGITGKVSQWHRMRAIAAEFRRRGRTVLIGGPYASLSPDVVRPHCDILVRGEIEDIAPKMFADLASGDYADEYVGTRPDMRISPIPRWDLYPNDRAIMGAVQTSRGCPFECEFCDVIEYLGRKQRHKQPEQVIAELDHLYDLGYRSAFLADDNFTVYRAHAKALLAAMRDWNARRAGGRFRFMTQVSIDAAGDEELLTLCADAGLTRVFIGIESPNEESLREVKKRQNLKKNLVDEIQRIVDFGISVVGGMIVGFDGDDANIFQRQYDFAMATAVPIFSLGTLVAPDATPLHARLAKEGRLFDNSAVTTAAPWHSNIIPKQMTREQVVEGVKWLCNSLYRPEAFEKRIASVIATFGRRRPRRADSADQLWVRAVNSDAMTLIQRISRLGPAEKKMLGNVLKMVRENPAATPYVMANLFQYAQARHMYERGNFWEPQIAANAGAILPRPREIGAAAPALA
jgi:radical SAM superfamily enzyme YgiQ (UPF0313 family)